MITPHPCGSSSKTNVWKKSSVLCRKKLVKNVFILFCLFEHIFNQSQRFASYTKSCLRGPELGFNRPIFAMIFLHRIVIRTPKMVREDIVVPLVITSHISDWINSGSWAAFLVSALALSISNLLFKALDVELQFAVQIRLYFCHLGSKFWLFKNPYCSTWVLSCPGHVEGTQRLNFWCCFSGKMTAYLKRLFCNLQYKNVCILLGFDPILNF